MNRDKTVGCLCAITLLFGVSTSLSAKCSLVFVDAQGEIQAGKKSQTVAVRVYPKGSQQFFEGTARPVAGKFEVEVAFNTLKSVPIFGWHNCSSRPEKVVVTVMQDNVPLQSIQLSIDKDFIWNVKTGRWTLKAPLVFAGEE